MELDERIVKTLFDEGKVEKKDLVNMYKIHQANNTPLEKLLVQFKLVKREDMAEVKTRLVGMETYLVDADKVNPDIATKIPKDMAKCYNLIAFDESQDGTVSVAMHNPADSAAIEYVKKELGKEIKTYAALLIDLDAVWDEVYSEKKKNKLFFYKKTEEEKKPHRVIPKKFSLPGLGKEEDEEEEKAPEPVAPVIPEKTTEAIKEVTETLRIKAPNDQDIQKSVDSLQREMEVLTILTQSASALNTIMDEETVIKRILETGLKLCKAEAGSILMLDEVSQTLEFREALGSRGESMLRKRISLSDTSIAGWVAMNRKPQAVNNAKQDERHYKDLDKILGFETVNLAAVPIIWGGKIIGVMEIINKADGDFSDKDLEYLSILASQAAIALHNTSILDQYKDFYLEVVEIFIDCVESLNPDIKEDAHQTARLASAMARQLHLSKDQFEDVCYAAFLLNIGMIKLRQDEERQHPTVGAEMLERVKMYEPLVPLIRHHHERYNGSGYPDGLSEESIPIGARVLAIAGDYIEGRRKRKDISDERYYEEFIKGFGSRYDPGLKLVFMSIMQP